MPLFSNKFSPKKTPFRKVTFSFSDADDRNQLPLEEESDLKLKLGDRDFIFEDGVWKSELGARGENFTDYDEMYKLMHELQEENNALKLKLQLLLDMLSETTAESHLTRKKVDELRRQLLSSSVEKW